MRSVKRKITTVWVVQPKIRFNDRSSNNLDLISEAVALTKALPGSKLVGSSTVKVENLSPREFFSKGKVEELASLVRSNEIQLVIINGQISPVQQQNLEKNGKLKY